MHLRCPHCQGQITLAPDRIPGHEFLLTCPACRSALAVELSVRKLPSYLGDAELVKPASADTPLIPSSKAEASQSDGAGRLREMVFRLLQRGLEDIPVLDKLTLKAWAVVQNPQGHEEEIGNLVRRDSALVSRIIRLANSGPRAGLEPVADLGQALRRLGPGGVEDIVLGSFTQRMYRPLGATDSHLVTGLWDHSVAVAAAAQWISRGLGQVDVARAFQAGLLHDIGRVLALRVLSDAAARSPQVRRALLREQTCLVIDAHHEEMGGILLEKCGFPLDVVVAARKHHNPSELSDNLAVPLVVSLADLVARRVGMDVSPSDASLSQEGDLAAQTLATRLGLPEERLAALEVEMEIHQAEMKRLLAA